MSSVDHPINHFNVKTNPIHFGALLKERWCRNLTDPKGEGIYPPSPRLSKASLAFDDLACLDSGLIDTPGDDLRL